MVNVISLPYIFQVLYDLCLLGQDSRCAFTGPLVLWFFYSSGNAIIAFTTFMENIYDRFKEQVEKSTLQRVEDKLYFLFF